MGLLQSQAKDARPNRHQIINKLVASGGKEELLSPLSDDTLANWLATCKAAKGQPDDDEGDEGDDESGQAFNEERLRKKITVAVRHEAAKIAKVAAQQPADAEERAIAKHFTTFSEDFRKLGTTGAELLSGYRAAQNATGFDRGHVPADLMHALFARCGKVPGGVRDAPPALPLR